MRRFGWTALAAVLALTATSIAIAAEKSGGKTEAVSATFTAERARVKERTCTGADGNYRIAHEVFKGTSESTDPRLAGTIVLHLHSRVNESTGLGVTHGHVVLRDGERKVKGKARLSGVNTRPGALEGLLAGHVRGNRRAALPGGKLVANFEVTFSSATKLTGILGGAGSTAEPAVIQGGPCRRADDEGEREGEGESDGEPGRDGQNDLGNDNQGPRVKRK